MNLPHKHNQKGFTIIEVVLVLAIAGLIFLMVFIALPSLQRGQRDTQRKNDLSRVQVQLVNYLSSTRGSAPTNDNSLGKFVTGYLKGSGPETAGDDYKDPNGNNYNVRFGGAPGDVGQVRYHYQSACDVAVDGIGVKGTGAARDFALTIKLENQSAPYCIDNKS